MSKIKNRLSKICFYFMNLPLRKKIVSIILAANIMLVSSFVLFSAQLIIQADNQLLNKNISKAFSDSSLKIIDVLENAENLSDSIATDENINELLLENATSGNEEIINNNNKKLNRILVSYYNDYSSYIEFMDVYTPDYTVSTNIQLSEQTYSVIYYAIVRKANFGYGEPQWSTKYDNDGYVYLSQSIENDNASMGVLVIKINVKKIIENTYGSEDTNISNYILLDGSSHIIYQSSDTEEMDIDALNALKRYDYTIITHRQQDYFVVNTPLLDYNLDYFCFVPYDNISYSIFKLILIYFGIIILSILFSIFISTQLIKLLTKDFDNLLYKFKHFRGYENDMPYIEDNYLNRQDDLAILHQQFNHMAKEIHDLIHQNYENELLIKETRIRVLEEQINPHFLYNTLESINWRAKAISETQISQMIEALGRLTRQSLDENEGLITIEREISFINDYMYIQSLRYEELLEFHMDVSPDCLNGLIPKLSIQPLVENAIKYGLQENADGCKIFLTVERQQDKINIIVKNSDTYLDPDIITKLSNKEFEHKGSGIGLLNVHKRMLFNFGDEYNIEFSNKAGYAIIVISIPYTEE